MPSNTVRPSKAPNLLVAPVVYDQRYIDQLNNALRLYFNQIDNFTQNMATAGTVTNVSALTIGTAGTNLSSTVANATTTPVITLNVPTASATNRGALSAADWSTFNGKQSYVPYIDVRNYGYVADGVTNNYTAVTNAIAALPATGGALYFPPGVGIINSTITITYPASGYYSVSFIGAGADVTTLQFNGCNGIVINAQDRSQSAHFMDFTATTNAAGTYNGITVNQTSLLGAYAQNDFTRVNLRGHNASLTTYWSTAIKVVGMSNFNYDGLLIYGNAAGTAGTGISFEGNPALTFEFSVVHNIIKCGLYNLNIGINYGTYIQGATVTQTNIVNGTTGIYLAASAVGATQLSCTLCNFNTTGQQIDLQGPIATVNLSSNSFYVPSGFNGVYINAAGGFGYTINGNSFYGLAAGVGTGVNVNASTVGVVTGNYFGSLATGVNLVGTSSFNVQANSYSGTTTQVANIGANSVGVATT